MKRKSQHGIGSSVLLDVLHPRLPRLRPVVCLSEQLSLPLVQPLEELAPVAHAEVARILLPRRTGPLPRMQSNIGSTRDIGPPQHAVQLALLEQVHQASRQPVEVRALVAQRYRAGVGLQGLGDLAGQRGREGQVDEGLGVLVCGTGASGVGQGEHFGEPQGQGELGAGLEGLGGVVVKVAEVGDLEIELAWNFLGRAWR